MLHSAVARLVLSSHLFSVGSAIKFTVTPEDTKDDWEIQLGAFGCKLFSSVANVVGSSIARNRGCGLLVFTPKRPIQFVVNFCQPGDLESSEMNLIVKSKVCS